MSSFKKQQNSKKFGIIDLITKKNKYDNTKNKIDHVGIFKKKQKFKIFEFFGLFSEKNRYDEYALPEKYRRKSSKK
jgi:hypothetical protein